MEVPNKDEKSGIFNSIRFILLLFLIEFCGSHYPRYNP